MNQSRPVSPALSYVSVKTDHSKGNPPDFNEPRPVSPALSSVSVKTDHSKGNPPDFNEPRPPTQPVTPPSEHLPKDLSEKQSADFSEQAGSSENEEEKSEDPLVFINEEKVLSKKLKKRMREKYKKFIKESPDTELYKMNTKTTIRYNTMFTDNVRTVLTEGLAGIGKTFQTKTFVANWAKGKSNKTVDLMFLLDFAEFNSEKSESIENVLNSFLGEHCNYNDYKITLILDGLEKYEHPLDFDNNKELTDIKAPAPMDVLLTNLIKGKLLPSARLWILTQPSAADRIPSHYIHALTECRETVKQRWTRLVSSLKERFKNEIGSKAIHPNQKNTEHILKADGQTKAKPVTSITSIFEGDSGRKIRTVLTIGKERVGKSFLVQEFTKKWLEGKSLLSQFTNYVRGKDEAVIFPLKFSELHSQGKVSLVGLLNIFFKETKECVFSDYNELKIIFVLDGLDDYQPTLDFNNIQTLTDVNEPASVDVILTNLISGNLLPSARIWITSRPSDADRLPKKYIHKKTEIRDKDAKAELSKQLKKQICEQHKNKGKEQETELHEINTEAGERQPVKVSYCDVTRRKVRTVLTKGVPGIGKTFQKEVFMVEWATGKTETNTDLVFSFHCDELKQTMNKSLEEMLSKCFDCKAPKGCYYNEYEITIILDGLEKCALPLDFDNNKELTGIKAPAPMDVLLTNLIKGKLLPSARLWILTQPSAADRIPSQYIHALTECRETVKRRQKLVSTLKKSLKENFREDLAHLNQRNTEHILRQTGGAEVNEKKEKRQINTDNISDVIKGERDAEIRTVLTIGEGGIGKSYLVQKLTNVWANSQSGWLSTGDESLLFPLRCSKLKLTQKISLVGVLNFFFKETKECVISDYNEPSVIFVLDGLDDYQPPLDFNNIQTLTDVNEPASVDVILTNLISGNLLPSARIWITSRPSDADRLPEECIDKKTEIREKPDIVSQRDLKKKLRDQFDHVTEGVDRDKASAFLKDIYTDLYIIEGERGEVYQQTESRQVQQAKNKEVINEIPIKYQDIFKSSPERPADEIKTVLTTGVAGIGKTFASMKYMLDWAEGSANEDIYFTFPLPFRELNLRKDTEYSLEELIHQFFPLMKTSEITNYDQYKILVVLDGLDECRLDLNFTQSLLLSDIKQKTSVNILLMNLIQRNLLPKAQIWITSRPAASLCIPATKVDRVTEVRGFNEEQKEEYFRKRFTNKDLAEKILFHVKKSRSIYIMCYIPVFCWIAAKVLEDFVERGEDQGMPKTLTDLYIHFLLLQCRQTSAKYSEGSTGKGLEAKKHEKTILALGKLAFEELEKKNQLFYEDDLTSYGLDIEEAAVFSGLLTEIIRDECEVVNSKRVFCFVHMSIQEFLAAFYVFHTFNNEGKNVLSSTASADISSSDFFKMAVDKALESKNGDWDMFIRFLLGLSLENNQCILQELLKKSENNEKTNKETISYIKEKINEESSNADMNMNLFHCLNELNDHSLVDEVKKYLQTGKNDFENFSPSKWSALTFVLLTSDEKLEVFDLKKYLRSERVLLGMLPVVKESKRALLSWCELSELSCDGLSSSVLKSAFSNLTELDLSHNDILDSGIQKLSEGLKDVHCKVEILKLAGCQITAEGCSFLATALKYNKSSQLKEIDLSYNHPGENGERMLSNLVEDPKVKLKKVCLDHCGEQRLKPGLKKYAADLTLDANIASKRLILSEEKRRAETWVKVEDRDLKRPLSPLRTESCVVSQVFCEQKLTGLWYWEVEWSGTVGIGVSYENADEKNRTGNVMGRDKNSWSVFCSNSSNKWQNDADHLGKQRQKEKVQTQRKHIMFSSKGPHKMAVFLDWERGTLTYYDITSGELEHKHTFHSTFKEPLVPGFWFKTGSVRLNKII